MRKTKLILIPEGDTLDSSINAFLRANNHLLVSVHCFNQKEALIVYEEQESKKNKQIDTWLEDIFDPVMKTNKKK